MDGMTDLPRDDALPVDNAMYSDLGVGRLGHGTTDISFTFDLVVLSGIASGRITAELRYRRTNGQENVD